MNWTDQCSAPLEGGTICGRAAHARALIEGVWCPLCPGCARELGAPYVEDAGNGWWTIVGLDVDGIDVPSFSEATAIIAAKGVKP